jgi:hypothetical protein
MIFHSKIEEKLYLLICFAWGMRRRSLVPPVFKAERNGKEISFTIDVVDHKDKTLTLPNKGKSDYKIVIIPNKVGDNLILLEGKDVWGKETITFQEVAPLIKYKERIEYTHGI